MKSNVRLRSNIYVRRPVSVREDMKYRGKVHGRKALRKLLDKIERYDTPERAFQWLTKYQLKEWNGVMSCFHCRTQVYGPVRTGQTVSIEFRCPLAICPRNADSR